MPPKEEMYTFNPAAGFNSPNHNQEEKDFYEGKHDAGKVRFDLLDPSFEFALAKVMLFGLRDHKENSWQTVPNSINRYYAALRRHANAVRKGEIFDPDSGLQHMAHVAINAMFLFHLYEEQMKESKTNEKNE